MNPDGSKTVYELNINYGDALGENTDLERIQAKKMLAAHNILLSFIGVPAIYYHSLFGSHGDKAAVVRTKDNRQINREKLDADTLISELESNQYRHTIHEGLRKLIETRGKRPEFDPYGEQKVFDLGKNVFVFERYLKNSNSKILCITNVSDRDTTVELPFSGKDLIRDEEVGSRLKIAPYSYYWIRN